jgi:phage terminase small subunit
VVRLAVKKLTAKQEKFCYEYLVDLNLTQAAIRAGFAEKSAAATARRLLKIPAVQDLIQRLKADALEAIQYSHEGILNELFWVATSNYTNIVKVEDNTITLRNLDELPHSVTCAIKSISKGPTGDWRVVMHDKVTALIKLADLYNEDLSIKFLTDRGYKIEKCSDLPVE